MLLLLLLLLLYQDNRSLEECNAILFREYYDKQFAKKRQWLSDVIQDRVAKEEFCHSVVK